MFHDFKCLSESPSLSCGQQARKDLEIKFFRACMHGKHTIIFHKHIFAKLHFAENPIEIEQPVQKISAIKEFPKQKETKGNTSFVWLYLKINISDFRLILLDHITYILTKTWKEYSGSKWSAGAYLNVKIIYFELFSISATVWYSKIKQYPPNVLLILY